MRSRGRPKGTRNGMRMTKGWNPKKWKPLYDTIIALHINGIKNKEIADRLKLHVVSVGYVLNSELGKAKIAELQAKYKEAIRDNTRARLEQLSARALANVEKVIGNSELLNKSPFAMFDRSLKVLHGVGTIKEESTPEKNPVTNLNVLIANEQVASRLIDGLAKVNEIKKLNAST